jgi:hypothetical protein
LQSLLRIPDATEKLAIKYCPLIHDRNFYRRCHESRKETSRLQARIIKGAKDTADKYHPLAGWNADEYHGRGCIGNLGACRY